MSRTLKPYKVDKVRLPDNTEVVLYLDRNSQKFFVEVVGQKVTADTIDACKHAAVNTWRAGQILDWRKFVVVNLGSSYGRRCEVYFSYEVIELAKSSEGRWLECHRNGSGEIIGTHARSGVTPDSVSLHTHLVLLAWSESLEQACAALRERVGALSRQLNELVRRSDAEQMLAGWVQKMLPAPKEGAISCTLCGRGADESRPLDGVAIYECTCGARACAHCLGEEAVCSNCGSADRKKVR